MNATEPRARHVSGDPKACSFCALTLQETRLLVARQGLYICDRCIWLANQVLHESASRANERVRFSPLTNAELRCSFCWITLQEKAVMSGTRYVCGECIRIFDEKIRQPRGHKPPLSDRTGRRSF
jgi:hypothetical protein